MIPIQELLNRIRWDPVFGRGYFEIGYLDRVAGGIVRVPLEEVQFPPDDHFSFIRIAPDGAAHSIPFHRVRRVFKDNELIWQR